MRITVERVAVRGVDGPVEAGALRSALRRELAVALAGRRPAGSEATARLLADATAAAVRGVRR
jgi:hypothetical protein